MNSSQVSITRAVIAFLDDAEIVLPGIFKVSSRSNDTRNLCQISAVSDRKIGSFVQLQIWTLFFLLFRISEKIGILLAYSASDYVLLLLLLLFFFFLLVPHTLVRRLYSILIDPLESLSIVIPRQTCQPGPVCG